MSEGLGKGHVAPPPLTLRMEAHDALLHVFCQSGSKRSFIVVALRLVWIVRERSQQLSIIRGGGLVF